MKNASTAKGTAATNTAEKRALAVEERTLFFSSILRAMVSAIVSTTDARFPPPSFWIMTAVASRCASELWMRIASRSKASGSEMDALETSSMTLQLGMCGLRHELGDCGYGHFEARPATQVLGDHRKRRSQLCFELHRALFRSRQQERPCRGRSPGNADKQAEASEGPMQEGAEERAGDHDSHQEHRRRDRHPGRQEHRLEPAPGFGLRSLKLPSPLPPPSVYLHLPNVRSRSITDKRRADTKPAIPHTSARITITYRSVVHSRSPYARKRSKNHSGS